MAASVRAVLFDLYGTLLAFGDMMAAWRAWGGLIYERMLRAGVQIDMATWPGLLEEVFAATGPEPDIEGLTVHEGRLMGLATRVGARIDDDGVRAMATDGLVLWQREMNLAPGAREVLIALRQRGYATGLVTNFDHPPHVQNLIEEHGLAPLLDVVVISGAVGLKKPDPAIMALALEALQVPAAEAVFVGDSPEDVQAAQGAGMAALGIVHDGDGSRLEEVTPDALVTSLDEVVVWLEERAAGQV
ncbi:MAG: HAD family hydrolase [Anaerolineae bacterium]|nr:HAD family hydrolase [Anaerolineae bacterium]